MTFKGIIREFLINRISRFFNVKTIIHIHGGKYLFDKPQNSILNNIVKILLNGNDNVIVLSEIEKNILKINYGFADSYILPNAVIIQNENKIKIFSKVPTFLFLGRIHESKGIYEIIELFEKLIKKDVEFTFVMYGDGPLKEYAVNKLNLFLGNRFIYGGVVSSKNKMDVISKADYFLLPSRYGEGLPLALLEAMSEGLIPIVTNNGSMDSLVQDGFNGIKVNLCYKSDIYLKTLEVLENIQLQMDISKNAILTVSQYHNFKNYIESLNNIYPK